MPREADARYLDPLDEVWRSVASALGLRIARGSHVFAATDGAGTLTVGTPETLDRDDCLGQIIFHELCHSLIQGRASFARPDWGLANEDDRDREREHACLRLQAALTRPHGLGRIFGPTTEFRAFYDALCADPLAGDDASARLARLAFERSRRPPWHPHLDGGLRATRAIAEAVAPFAHPGSLWSRFDPP